jgi:hypothetical protein
MRLRASSFSRRALCCCAAVLGALGCGGKAVIDGEDTTSSTTTSSSTTTTGSGSIESIEILSALVFANCQPVIAPDPLGAEIVVRFNNMGSAAANVTLVGASLEAEVGVTVFSMSPPAFPASVGTSDVTLVKDEGSASGTLGCDFCTATDIAVELSFEIDGNGRSINAPIDSIGCTK